MVTKIKKAIIPVTLSDEELFPLTRCVPKELLPLGDIPVIQRIVDETLSCGVEEIVFLLSADKKGVINQFTNIEKLSDDYELFKNKYAEITFSYLTQKKNSSNGYAVYKAKEKSIEDPFALSIPDTVFYGKKSSLEQLFAVHRTSQKDVVGLQEVDESDVSSSCIVETEKIANRFYKIKKVMNNPSENETSSRLALAGRYIFTPVVFDYLKNNGAKTSIADALNEMIGAGKTVYGHECEGKWLSLENKEKYLEAQSFFSNNR